MSEKSLPIGPDETGTAAIAGRLGAAAVTASDRIVGVTAKVGNAEAQMPYAFDSSGHPVLLQEVVDAASEEHIKRFPDRIGSYNFSDLGSLVAWSKRYATPATAAFCMSPDQRNAGRVRVVVDEMPAADDIGARRALSATVPLTLSDRLLAWLGSANTLMAVDAFSDLISRASDELGNAELATMVNNVEVREETSWKRTVGDDGRIKLLSEDSTVASRVPSTFTFHVPVFDGDDEQNAQSFTARLTLKVEKGKPRFSYEVTDFKARMAHAMATIRTAIAEVVPATYMGVGP